jgi:putative endonuclease
MRNKGDYYEQQAASWLQQQGLQAVAQNFQCRGGEIDLIMLQHDTLCFIEVKYRSSNAFGGAAFSIPISKQKKIIHAMLTFLHRNKRYSKYTYRFDALFITPQAPASEALNFEWIQNAFSAAEDYYC